MNYTAIINNNLEDKNNINSENNDTNIIYYKNIQDDYSTDYIKIFPFNKKEYKIYCCKNKCENIIKFIVIIIIILLIIFIIMKLINYNMV